MSHLFVLERTMAHIKIRVGKIPTPHSVLSCLLLFLYTILNQTKARLNKRFSFLVCALSEAKGMD